MKDYPKEQCDVCGADVVWTISAKNGGRVAVNYEVSRLGTISIVTDWDDKLVSHTLSERFRFGRTDLHTQHRCPARRGGR